MSRKSAAPRKDIGSVLHGLVRRIDLSEKDYRDLEQAGSVSLKEEHIFGLKLILEQYDTFSRSTQERPARQAVRSRLEEWRHFAKSLCFSTNRHGPKSDAATSAAMERLRNMQFDETRAHLWNGSGFGEDTPYRLMLFFLACEKAIADLDAETDRDKGGRSGDKERDSLLSRLENLFLEAGGKSQYREAFIRAAVEKLPKQNRPNLPERNGEILKIINEARRRCRYRRALPKTWGGESNT